MLSDPEKQVCQQILALLPDGDVFALMATLTGYVVATDNRIEAEKAILTFTESLRVFLNRKKVTKEILVKYCWENSLRIPAHGSKSDIIEAIMKCLGDHVSNSVKTEHLSPPAYDYRDMTSNNATSLSKLTQPAGVPVVNNIVIINSERNTYNRTYNLTGCHGTETSTDQSNAEAFVKWFYEMVNSHHPSHKQPSSSYGPQHFWENSQLFLVMKSSAGQENETVSGSFEVANRLSAFAKMNQLLFNPNVSRQGVKMQPHSSGSRLIMVCGTLHNTTQVVGIFQQSFALVSDPLSPESWKVMVTCLKLDQCMASNVPCIEECTDLPEMEAHTKKTIEAWTQLRLR